MRNLMLYLVDSWSKLSVIHVCCKSSNARRCYQSSWHQPTWWKMVKNSDTKPGLSRFHHRRRRHNTSRPTFLPLSPTPIRYPHCLTILLSTFSFAIFIRRNTHLFSTVCADCWNRSLLTHHQSSGTRTHKINFCIFYRKFVEVNDLSSISTSAAVVPDTHLVRDHGSS
jgi:hypothetical protein